MACVLPVLSTADKCIDSTVVVVSSIASALQESVATQVIPVQSSLVEIQSLIVAKNLNMVDFSDFMIDQIILLPESLGPRKRSRRSNVLS